MENLNTKYFNISKQEILDCKTLKKVESVLLKHLFNRPYIINAINQKFSDCNINLLSDDETISHIENLIETEKIGIIETLVKKGFYDWAKSRFILRGEIHSFVNSELTRKSTYCTIQLQRVYSLLQVENRVTIQIDLPDYFPKGTETFQKYLNDLNNARNLVSYNLITGEFTERNIETTSLFEECESIKPDPELFFRKEEIDLNTNSNYQEEQMYVKVREMFYYDLGRILTETEEYDEIANKIQKLSNQTKMKKILKELDIWINQFQIQDYSLHHVEIYNEKDNGHKIICIHGKLIN